MIKSVTVVNHLGKSLKMVLEDPDASGLLIEKIDGIGPTKATINSVQYAVGDGTIFNSSRLDKRNITMILRPMGTPDVETNRHLAYQMFPNKKEVRLLFETDHRECFCIGHVEECTPDIFSEEETINISILCDDPFFYATANLYVLNGIDDLFEFPFSNESLTEDLINFGELRYDVGAPIEYYGDADSGCVIRLECDGDVKNPSITNLETGEQMSIDTTKFSYIVGATGDGADRLIAKDVLEICTIFGKKSVVLYRGGKAYNCIGCLSLDTDWLTIHTGTNVFSYKADVGIYNCSIDISSYIVYSGV